jgi:hypothetical protein
MLPLDFVALHPGYDYGTVMLRREGEYRNLKERRCAARVRQYWFQRIRSSFSSVSIQQGLTEESGKAHLRATVCLDFLRETGN